MIQTNGLPAGPLSNATLPCIHQVNRPSSNNQSMLVGSRIETRKIFLGVREAQSFIRWMKPWLSRTSTVSEGAESRGVDIGNVTRADTLNAREITFATASRAVLSRASSGATRHPS
jgi:hypothetical protein